MCDSLSTSEDIILYLEYCAEKPTDYIILPPSWKWNVKVNLNSANDNHGSIAYLHLKYYYGASYDLII